MLAFLCVCSNSEYIDYPSNSELRFSGDNVISASTNDTFNSTDRLYPIDTEYPYAGIPRLVIKTDNFQPINNRDTKIPAKMQLWGESSPISKVINLTIKERGNSSWLYMPKKKLQN